MGLKLGKSVEQVHIEYMALAELVTRYHPRNPKDHDQSAIASSLKTFGYVDPGVIDERSGLFAEGHGRTQALAALKAQGQPAPDRIDVRKGEWYVPVIRGISFETDAQLEAYLVAANRLTILGGWNEPMLVEVLRGLARESEVLLQSSGYDAQDLQALIEELTPPIPVTDPGAQIDKAAELQEKWQVARGQLWQIGNHRLLCGDSTNADDVARVMGGDKADICFTSPPYNVAANSSLPNKQKYIGQDDAKPRDAYLALLQCATEHARQCSEYVFVNLQMVSGNKASLIDYLHLNKSLLAEIIIWDKTTAEPAMAENVLNSRFEFIFVFSDKGTRAIGTRSFRGTLENLVPINSRQDKDYSDAHKATFPTEFAAHFISSFASKTVYDPFGGSGTTMVACEQLGRVCRMIEISEKYCAVILERLSNMGLESHLIE